MSLVTNPHSDVKIISISVGPKLLFPFPSWKEIKTSLPVFQHMQYQKSLLVRLRPLWLVNSNTELWLNHIIRRRHWEHEEKPCRALAARDWWSNKNAQKKRPNIDSYSERDICIQERAAGTERESERESGGGVESDGKRVKVRLMAIY